MYVIAVQDAAKKYPQEFEVFVKELDEFLDRGVLVQANFFSVEDIGNKKVDHICTDR